MKRSGKWLRGCLSMVLAILLSVTGIFPCASTAMAETVSESVISSMAYDDGPTFTVSGLSEGSFGFRMPFFNGGANTWSEVASDLSVNVKVDGAWKDIDSVDKFVYNSNWGHWSDGGFNGYWFKVTESTYIQLYSKSNPSVTLDYNLILNTADTSAVTALSADDGTSVSANRTGTGFIAFPNAIANGGSFPTGADNLVAYVKLAGEPDSAYVNIDNNAESGWIYNTNFGVERYGYWFKVEDTGSINVKLALKDNENVSLVYNVTYADTVRDNYKVHANGATTITADSETGAAGVVFPYLGGTATDNLPTNKELDNFVIEYYDASTRAWVEFANSAVSGWYYQGNGYVNYSAKNQWGYFDDYVFGLWFQPITEDFKLRIGYPESGVKGDAVGNNYIEYQFIGAPNAFRPEDVEVGDIIVGGDGSDANALEGWDLFFHDEFNGTTLNMNNWSYNTGYFLDPSDPGTFGWGNNEAEYYTDEADNIYVNDGALHLVAKYEPYTFTCTDAAQTKVTADYSSGKIISKNKVAFTYGRVDFRAKLPAGQGLWPALWMLPNDDVYGTWASSGEIDVMEARGRVTNATSGTIHYGGTWPNNTYTGTDYIFPEGSTFDDGYHVYSVIWEEDNMTWYVDGEFFQYLPKELWYSANSNSDTAPFDQNFYLIMNLAVGGWFDGGVLPGSDFTSAEMLVDYVRVYKAEGSAVGDHEIAGGPAGEVGGETGGTTGSETGGTTGGVTGDETGGTTGGETGTDTEVTVSDECGVLKNTDGTLTFYVKAQDTEFAPMLYWGVNKHNPALSDLAGVAFTKDNQLGDNYFSYTTGTSYADTDTVSYMFSYTPLDAAGRMDTEIFSVQVSAIGSGTVGEDNVTGGDNTTPEDNTTPGDNTTPDDSTEPDNGTDDVIGSDAYGVLQNADGTLTFYVYANENEAAPLVFWGLNKVNPDLSELSGAPMERTGGAEGYFTYTLTEKVESGASVSYMFGYTPLGETGRRDTAIVTEVMN